ncbi:MAG: GNAT family N-acetyltransferase [Deltaproteobacteria bacterium]|nr:GNAT family N-acetyltransferase [Deltaproteobacteria bacterium]MBW2531982.1 GNAT family N-acetyltransferase [Deltaproteobacteria bacterium]
MEVSLPPVTVEVVAPDAVDLEDYCRLQRAAFARVLLRAGVSDRFMTPALYRWKYRPPSGPGRLALVRRGRRLVGSLGMIPVPIRHGGRRALAWHIGDVATAPDERRQGHCRAGLIALDRSLGADEMIVGFPNASSSELFGEIGARPLARPRTWIGWTRTLTTRPHRSSPQSWERSDRVGHLHEAVCPRDETQFERSSSYLDWRYRDHPQVSYDLLVHGEPARGFAVVRRAAFRAIRFGLLMELWATSVHAERDLLRAARRWARERNLAWLAAIGAGSRRWTMVQAGLAPVPTPLIPRRLIMMGKGTGATTRDAAAARWHLQAGDWDAF